MTPETPADPEVQIVQLAAGPVAYTDEGPPDAPVILMLHGLPGSIRDFRWLTPALPDFRVLRLDQPGFGQTPLATCPTSDIGPLATLVGELVDRLGAREVFVLGHSFGGMVATEVALLLGDRARGLVLLSSVGIRPHRGRRSVRWWPALSLGLRMPLVRDRILPPLREGYVRAGFSRSLPDQALVQSAHRVAWCDFERHARNLRTLRLPTAVAWCEDDPMVEPAISEELYWNSPTGPRIAFGSGGHNLQKTRAIELGEALSAWIPQVLEQGPA